MIPEWVEWKRLYDENRLQRKWDSFSWLTLRALASSANDVLGKGAPRLVHDLRRHWVGRDGEGPTGAWDADRIVTAERDADCFVVIGDTGEQDVSQYAVVPGLLSQENVDFMVILSDVIYPAGDVNDYVDGFYVPLRPFKRPIYALPGNHDWYDGLNGFMWHFRGLEPVAFKPTTHYSLREWIARWLWLGSSTADAATLTPLRAERAAPEPWAPRQPGPYFGIRTKHLLVLCIDTGIAGDIDSEQADWLRDVAGKYADDPKLLLTGKPLIVDGEYKPGRVFEAPASGESPRTVDRIVRDPELNFVGAIGGDIHNYQRYTVELGVSQGDPPPDIVEELRGAPVEDLNGLHYIVSGGGGAFTSPTHPIRPRPLQFDHEDADAEAEVRVRRFACYPSRAESLAFYSRTLVPALWRIVCGTLATLAGIGLSALLALVLLDDEAETLEKILIGLAILAALAAIRIVFRKRPARKAQDAVRPRGHVTPFVAVGAGLVIGTLVGLAGWWLVPERFDESLKALAILIGGGALVAGGLRFSRLWRSPVAGVVALFAQLVGALAVIYAVALPSGARHEFWSVVLALSAPLVVWGATELALRAIALVLRLFGTGRDVARPRASAASPFFVGFFLAGAAVGIREFLSGHGDDDLHAVLVAWLGLVAIPLLLLTVDFSRRKLPRAYKHVSFAGIIALIAALSIVPWTRTGLVAFAVLLGLLVIGSLAAHLTYLWAWALLVPGADRTGDLRDEAGIALAWVDDRANPKPSTNAARAARMVYPGTTGPSGPLQALVAQIFDVDFPPMHKSFLVVSTDDQKLTIECYAVTGEETGPADFAQPIDTVVCHLT